ncbi:MAG: hypothetical protein KAG61_10950 [Bacteriovoracaceae bacterium]|nr:hypothetical protein [Bacteriovoracaceae bacterium]
MKKIFLLAAIIPIISMGSTLNSIGSLPHSERTCWSITLFELNFNEDEILALCAGNNIAPTQCYRFAMSALKSKKLAIQTCAKASSLMPKVDCITNYSEYPLQDIADICSKI